MGGGLRGGGAFCMGVPYGLYKGVKGFLLKKERESNIILRRKNKGINFMNWYRQSQKLELVNDEGTYTERELSRAIRDAINAENDAIKQYEVISDASGDQKASEVLQEIADEEKVHVGELQELLRHLGIGEQDFLDEGAAEVQSE